MRKIMIVDDEVLVRVGLQSLIKWEDHGFQLIGVYKNGQEAWEAVQRQSPDVLLTDIRMPEMDGLQLAKKIRLHNKKMSILIISSYEEFDYLRKSIQIGIQDYIPKYKLDPVELIQILNSLPCGENEGEPSKPSVQPSIELEKQELLLRTRPFQGMQVKAVSLNSNRFPILSSLGPKEEGKVFTWFALQPVPEVEGFSESRLRAFAVHVSEFLERMETTEYLGADGDILHGLMRTHKNHSYDEMNASAADLIEWIQRNLNMKFSIGVSSFTNNFSAMDELRKQAEISLQHTFYKGAGIYFFDKPLKKRSPWITEVIEYVYNHYHQPLPLEEIAERVNYSVNYFSERFHQETGQPFSGFLTRYRIQKASELLRNTDLSTEEIGARVGYPNANYFVKVFKKVTGRTITEFKNAGESSKEME
jgi:two-component system response regulator YesN